MRRLLLVAAAMLGVWACGESARTDEAQQDTLTRRQRDSVISEMPIPGASGVGAARRASDRMNERAEQHDTIR